MLQLLPPQRDKPYLQLIRLFADEQTLSPNKKRKKKRKDKLIQGKRQ